MLFVWKYVINKFSWSLTAELLCSFRKYPYPLHGRSLEILRVGHLEGLGAQPEQTFHGVEGGVCMEMSNYLACYLCAVHQFATVTLPVTGTIILFVYLFNFYRNLFDTCYSVDNEQEENEKKKVLLNIWMYFYTNYPHIHVVIICFFICVSPTIFFHYSATHVASQPVIHCSEFIIHDFKAMVEVT